MNQTAVYKVYVQKLSGGWRQEGTYLLEQDAIKRAKELAGLTNRQTKVTRVDTSRWRL